MDENADDSGVEEDYKSPCEDYIDNMRKLVERLKEEGLQGEDILILSPPICDQNYSRNYGSTGKPRWTYESRVLEYMSMLESKSEEWGGGLSGYPYSYG